MQKVALKKTYIHIALINMFVSFSDFFFHYMYFQTGWKYHRKHFIFLIIYTRNTKHNCELIPDIKRS